MNLALSNLQWLMCHKTKPNLYFFQSVWIAKSERIAASLSSAIGSGRSLYQFSNFDPPFANFPKNIMSYSIMPFFIFNRTLRGQLIHSFVFYNVCPIASSW